MQGILKPSELEDKTGTSILTKFSIPRKQDLKIRRRL